MEQPARVLWIIAGTLCVAAGVVGIALPVIPTTPFFLLAAYLFSRSSPRCHRWLVTNRFCGPFVRRYVERHAMSRRHKVATLAFLWAALGLSIALGPAYVWLRMGLGAIGAAVTIHVLAIPSD